MPSIGEQLELTPKDLNKFNKKMTDEILAAQKDGWRGHVNRQGHVSMLAPDGKDTVVISSNANAVNQLLLGVNRYKRRIGETVEEKPTPKPAPQKWPCARPNCPKVYATEQQLSTHIAVDHEKMLVCEYTNCFEVRPTKQKLSIHMTHAHGYVSPRKAQRKKQEANRKAKEKNAKGELTEEQREKVNRYIGDHPILGDRPDPEVSTGSKLIDDHIRRHADETTEIIREAGESTGRAIKDHMFRGVDSGKFDPHFVDRMMQPPTTPVMDEISADALVPQEGQTSLKGLTADILDDPTKWGMDADGSFTRVDDGTPLLDSQEVFNLQYSSSQAVTAEEIYRETNKRIKQERIAALREREESLEFIDERDSWTVDLNKVMDMDIRTVARVLNAAGLKLEMRTWVADKGD